MTQSGLEANDPLDPKATVEALLRDGRIEEAIEHLRSHCERRDEAEAELMLGQLEGQRGRFEEAAKRFRRAAELEPRRPDAHCGLGAALRALGRLAEAREALQKAVRHAPSLLQARVELGLVLHGLGELTEARRHLEHALTLNPALPAVHLRLGRLHHAEGRLEAAAGHYRQAVRHNPQLVEAHIDLGKVLIYLGDRENARAAFEAAMAAEPGNAEGLAGCAALDEHQGAYRRAYRSIAALEERRAWHEMAAVTYLSLCHHVKRCDAALEYAQRTLEQGALTPRNRRHVLFALGRRLDRMGRYEEAFQRYREANGLYVFGHDPAEFERYVDALIATFDGLATISIPRSSVTSQRPVFIVGMPRSGTSLVEQILAAHPAIHGAGELPLINSLVQALPERTGAGVGYPDCIGYLTRTVLDALAGEYLAHIDALAGDAERVTDKLPHNFLNLGLIALLFPNARIIHCRRDPLDTCLSIYFQDFNESHFYAADLEHIGLHYRQYRRLMDHWRRTLPLSLMEVDYETLVDSPQDVIDALCGFCGVERDPAMMRFHASGRLADTVSYDQVRQPLYSDSVGRWRHYEPYIGPLREALGM